MNSLKPLDPTAIYLRNHAEIEANLPAFKEEVKQFLKNYGDDGVQKLLNNRSENINILRRNWLMKISTILHIALQANAITTPFVVSEIKTFQEYISKGEFALGSNTSEFTAADIGITCKLINTILHDMDKPAIKRLEA